MSEDIKSNFINYYQNYIKKIDSGIPEKLYLTEKDLCDFDDCFNLYYKAKPKDKYNNKDNITSNLISKLKGFNMFLNLNSSDLKFNRRVLARYTVAKELLDAHKNELGYKKDSNNFFIIIMSTLILPMLVFIITKNNLNLFGGVLIYVVIFVIYIIIYFYMNYNINRKLDDFNNRYII